MKTTLKLFRLFMTTLILSLILLIFLNFLLFFLVFSSKIGTKSPWNVAQKTAESLMYQGNETYQLSSAENTYLLRNNIWAVLIDNDTLKVKWSSQNLPEEIPLKYSISELSWAIRGYIADYPTAVSEYGEDLLILGYPKNSLWKLIWNTFDYDIISHLPQIILFFLFVNLGIIIFLYIGLVFKVLHSLKPIVTGIESLPENAEVYVKEKGLMFSLPKQDSRKASAAGILSAKKRDGTSQLDCGCLT